MRVVVAMSGGVDSSVAAALLREAGHDVIGLSMQLHDRSEGLETFGSCCTLDDLNDARRVAAAIGIPHYILNLERQFEETVVADFVREYLRARTPLPCAHCNTGLKFSELVTRAAGFGAGAVATGHYARVGQAAGGPWQLRRGVDASKDQAYFLFGLTQDQLAHAIFPLGDLRKDQVRVLARERGLPVAEKRDSQEICFVPDNDYAAVVERLAPGRAAAGPILDTSGRELGRHAGIHHFTVGQRKGLGISSTMPLYVLRISSENGAVVVGTRADLERKTLQASRVNWIAGSAPSGPIPVQAQIRSRHAPAAAVVEPLDDRRARVEFDQPQSAITPGQAVVFYDGDVVLGGGWIEN